ncbi:unnamed protein product [Cylicocyclus nassatus]|uniref:Uncharacterized protein n=1 Tax=Cylicocyclus nassatus TaxID=53992 RepID=A0AA36GJU8_CYLNA|nr:unnamed protein product [Cylicocyclus nassatus]
MSRALVLLLLATVIYINATPVMLAEKFVPVAADFDAPSPRLKRQFGWGIPFSGNAFGNSWGYSQSSSFNMYQTGFNTGFWG